MEHGDEFKRIGDVRVRVEGRVVTAVLDRPQVRNAINTEVLVGLEAALDVAEESEASVLVLRGAGGTFCAGADLREMTELLGGEGKLEQFMVRLGKILDSLESASFATVAVVEGHAVAGGFELLLACDVVVAAAEARIGDGHLEYGLVPAAGSSVRLPRQLPRARAGYLLLTANLLTGREAADWGLATFAVPADELESHAGDIVERLVSRSRTGMARIKTVIDNSGSLPHEQACAEERALFMTHVTGADATRGLAAFRDRRVPVSNDDLTTRKD